MLFTVLKKCLIARKQALNNMPSNLLYPFQSSLIYLIIINKMHGVWFGYFSRWWNKQKQSISCERFYSFICLKHKCISISNEHILTTTLLLLVIYITSRNVTLRYFKQTLWLIGRYVINAKSNYYCLLTSQFYLLILVRTDHRPVHIELTTDLPILLGKWFGVSDTSTYGSAVWHVNCRELIRPSSRFKAVISSLSVTF